MTMERKRALLVAIGGRIAPDVLAIQAIRPHLIIILTSKEGCAQEPTLRLIAQGLPQEANILPTLQVEADEMDSIVNACLDACKPYSQDEWEWSFSIGSCPKIMSIAVYEVAKQMQIPCIHMDTQHDKIISLVKDSSIASLNFFHITVRDYMRIYQRELESFDGEKKRYREFAQASVDIIRLLALSPDTPQFSRLMQDKKVVHPPQVIPDALLKSNLLQDLSQRGVIHIDTNNQGKSICSFTSENSAKLFGTGDWLEVYVWSETEKANFADDCQWGCKIKSAAENELDGLLTYKAQFIMTECKTSLDPFSTKYLYAMDSKAGILGGHYTTRIFVTNAPNTFQSYKNFSEQARLRKIYVVTYEDLADLGHIMEREAKNPTYPRI